MKKMILAIAKRIWGFFVNVCMESLGTLYIYALIIFFGLVWLARDILGITGNALSIFLIVLSFVLLGLAPLFCVKMLKFLLAGRKGKINHFILATAKAIHDGYVEAIEACFIGLYGLVAMASIVFFVPYILEIAGNALGIFLICLYLVLIVVVPLSCYDKLATLWAARKNKKNDLPPSTS